MLPGMLSILLNSESSPQSNIDLLLNNVRAPNKNKLLFPKATTNRPRRYKELLNASRRVPV